MSWAGIVYKYIFIYFLGVNAFILVALERVPLFENAMLLEFGRGFRSKPLRVNLMDLDYELVEELVCVHCNLKFPNSLCDKLLFSPINKFKNNSHFIWCVGQCCWNGVLLGSMQVHWPKRLQRSCRSFGSKGTAFTLSVLI